MKSKIFIILSIIFTITSKIYSQENLIEVNNTSITMPKEYDFGEVSETAFTKYIIKNNRKSVLKISDIDTPAGFFANISQMQIKPGKKVVLYVGLAPEYVKKEGPFEQKISIKTNLITDIIIKIKGTVKKTQK
jgi:hypothetical protein